MFVLGHSKIRNFAIDSAYTSEIRRGLSLTPRREILKTFLLKLLSAVCLVVEFAVNENLQR